MSQLLGVVNQNAAVNALSMNVTTLITLVAYVMFGIIIAKSHAPLVNSSNEI
jgi:hypothetical protein